MSPGHQAILAGFERWSVYIRERQGKVVRKSLTDFYAEAFDDMLAADRAKREDKS